MKFIFIDTEFTNLIDKSLISIGLVADTGEEFYAEVAYDNAQCSEFVRDVVLPQLQREEADYCSHANLRHRILTWLTVVRGTNEPVVIGYDSKTDWNLFVDALNGVVPTWCSGRDIYYCLNCWLLENYYRASGDKEHHALHDARANRYAFRESVQQ